MLSLMRRRHLSSSESLYVEASPVTKGQATPLLQRESLRGGVTCHEGAGDTSSSSGSLYVEASPVTEPHLYRGPFLAPFQSKPELGEAFPGGSKGRKIHFHLQFGIGGQAGMVGHRYV